MKPLFKGQAVCHYPTGYKIKLVENKVPRPKPRSHELAFQIDSRLEHSSFTIFF